MGFIRVWGLVGFRVECLLAQVGFQRQIPLSCTCTLEIDVNVRQYALRVARLDTNILGWQEGGSLPVT